MIKIHPIPALLHPELNGMFDALYTNLEEES
jgi:hypothetical protein